MTPDQVELFQSPRSGRVTLRTLTRRTSSAKPQCFNALGAGRSRCAWAAGAGGRREWLVVSKPSERANRSAPVQFRCRTVFHGTVSKPSQRADRDAPTPQGAEDSPRTTHVSKPSQRADRDAPRHELSIASREAMFQSPRSGPIAMRRWWQLGQGCGTLIRFQSPRSGPIAIASPCAIRQERSSASVSSSGFQCPQSGPIVLRLIRCAVLKALELRVSMPSRAGRSFAPAPSITHGIIGICKHKTPRCPEITEYLWIFDPSATPVGRCKLWSFNALRITPRPHPKTTVFPDAGNLWHLPMSVRTQARPCTLMRGCPPRTGQTG